MTHVSFGLLASDTGLFRNGGKVNRPTLSIPNSLNVDGIPHEAVLTLQPLKGQERRPTCLFIAKVTRI
jgi:hypothetical protein